MVHPFLSIHTTIPFDIYRGGNAASIYPPRLDVDVFPTGEPLLIPASPDLTDDAIEWNFKGLSSFKARDSLSPSNKHHYSLAQGTDLPNSLMILVNSASGHCKICPTEPMSWDQYKAAVMLLPWHKEPILRAAAEVYQLPFRRYPTHKIKLLAQAIEHWTNLRAREGDEIEANDLAELVCLAHSLSLSQITWEWIPYGSHITELLACAIASRMNTLAWSAKMYDDGDQKMDLELDYSELYSVKTFLEQPIRSRINYDLVC